MLLWVSILFLLIAFFCEIMPFVILYSGPKLDGESFYAAASFSSKTKELKIVSWAIFIILLIAYFLQDK